jgi:hypothetical protein
MAANVAQNEKVHKNGFESHKIRIRREQYPFDGMTITLSQVRSYVLTLSMSEIANG